MSPIGVVGFAMGSAFGLWAIGVLIQRSKPALCARLGLHPLDYEYRLFHSSMAVGRIALVDEGLAQRLWGRRVDGISVVPARALAAVDPDAPGLSASGVGPCWADVPGLERRRRRSHPP